MDRVIIEELLRSVPIFFLAFVITIFLMVLFGLPTAPFYTVIGIPLVITGVVFSLFVYKRKSTGKEYKLKRGTTPYKVTMAMGTLASFGYIISRVRDIVYGDTLWVCSGQVLDYLVLLSFLESSEKPNNV